MDTHKPGTYNISVPEQPAEIVYSHGRYFLLFRSNYIISLNVILSDIETFVRSI